MTLGGLGALFLGIGLSRAYLFVDQPVQESYTDTDGTKANPGREQQPRSPVAPGTKQSAAAKSSKRQQWPIVIAWQPSHQDDTGTDQWHEYLICGDIVDRILAGASGSFKHIKCWDLQHGLTGTNNYRPRPTNTPAFDAEVKRANRAGARLFIAVHNDGGSPSGVLGEYLPGDPKGLALARKLVATVCNSAGLPHRGLRPVRLYSLESPRNRAAYKCLLEIGDNARDRAFLESPQHRATIAESLCQAAEEFALAAQEAKARASRTARRSP